MHEYPASSPAPCWGHMHHAGSTGTCRAQGTCHQGQQPGRHMGRAAETVCVHKRFAKSCIDLPKFMGFKNDSSNAACGDEA